jgi:hypothetical protein
MAGRHCRAEQKHSAALYHSPAAALLLPCPYVPEGGGRSTSIAAAAAASSALRPAASARRPPYIPPSRGQHVRLACCHPPRTARAAERALPTRACPSFRSRLSDRRADVRK